MRTPDPGFTVVHIHEARWSVCVAAALALLLSGGVSTGWAVTLTWDGDTGTSGLQDGGGNWNTTDNNRWWNGSGYQVWSNSPPDAAVFGNGGTGTALVTLTEPITVSGLRFKAGASYTITGSTLNFGTITVTNDAGTEATISSTISGTRMNKNGAGRLILTTANPLTGGCCADFYDGPVQLANGSALGSNQIHVYNGALELVGGITVGNTLYLEGQGVGSTGGLRSISGDNIWSGTLNLHWQGGTPNAAIGVDAGSLTINGGIGTMDGQDANGVDRVYPLTKVGAGKLIIKGVSNYNGVTTVSAGVLNIQNASALLGTTTNAGTIVASGAALELQHATGISVASEALTISGSGVGGGGSLRNVSGTNSWAGPVTLGGGARIGVDAGSLEISGNVGAAGASFVKVGAGRLILSGNNTFGNSAGALDIYGGALNLRSNTALGSTGYAHVYVDGSALEVEGNITVANGLYIKGYGIGGTGSLRSISGDNYWDGYVNLHWDNPNVAVGVDAGTLTIRGPVQNAGGSNGALHKVGDGTLVLANANPYSWPTYVDDGTLLVTNTTGSGTGPGAVTVNSGGTLGGTGIIATGGANVTVGAGGKLSPGMSAGTLTFNLGSGVLNISNVGIQGLLFELGAIGSSDQVKLTSGTLNIGSGLDLDNFQLTTIGGFQLGTYTLFDTPGTIAGSLGSNVWGTTGGYAAHLFFSPDGTDLQLEVVPEPSVLAMLLGLAGIGLAGYLRRRRRP